MAIVQVRRAPTAPGPLEPTAPISAADLALAIGADETRAGHVLAAAWELVERYAPDAPEALHREAVIRCSGWLVQQPAGSVRSEAEGEVSTSFAPSMTGALRHSGAMSLLSPWKVRRAGVIG
ncbi:MAG: hypothetical protein OXE86_19050 [Alphaproteobacteria bacterium]|nr:hypothetical protein [Alphaproteobacteria bacterium]